MKKMLSLYKGKGYMIRPTVYKAVEKGAVMLTLILLWDRYLNDGALSAMRDGCFVASICLAGLAWISYLQLDGIKNPLRGRPKEKKKTRFHSRDIIDFVDEHIVSFDELEDEERYACSMCSSLASALLFLIFSLVKFFL